jgi:hypothetical protein
MILSGEEGQRGQRMQVYFQLSEPGPSGDDRAAEENARRGGGAKAELEEKQSQQQTLVYEQKPSRRSWSRRVTSVKRPFPAWSPPFSKVSSS